MNTRPLSVREKLLEAASVCFYISGVNKTGIDTITSTAGVVKMSLYNNFASKSDLVLAYLERRHHEWLELYRVRIGAGEGKGRDGIRAVFDAYIDHAEKSYAGGFRGCGLLNAAAELPAKSPGRQLVRDQKVEIERILAGHLTEDPAIPAYQIAPLAQQLSFLVEGAVVRAGLNGSPDLLYRAREIAFQIMAAAAAEL